MLSQLKPFRERDGGSTHEMRRFITQVPGLLKRGLAVIQSCRQSRVCGIRHDGERALP